MITSQTGTHSCRGEEEREKASLQQHSVGLVAREILRRADERQKAHEAHRQRDSWPDIEHQQDRGHNPNPANGHQHVRAAREPEKRGRIPEALQSEFNQRLQIFVCRQDAVRTNQSLDLKQEWIKGGEIDETEPAQEYPPRKRTVRGATFRGKQPAERDHKSDATPSPSRSYADSSGWNVLLPR